MLFCIRHYIDKSVLYYGKSYQEVHLFFFLSKQNVLPFDNYPKILYNENIDNNSALYDRIPLPTIYSYSPNLAQYVKHYPNILRTIYHLHHHKLLRYHNREEILLYPFFYNFSTAVSVNQFDSSEQNLTEKYRKR